MKSFLYLFIATFISVGLNFNASASQTCSRQDDPNVTAHNAHYAYNSPTDNCVDTPDGARITRDYVSGPQTRTLTSNCRASNFGDTHFYQSFCVSPTMYKTCQVLVNWNPSSDFYASGGEKENLGLSGCDEWMPIYDGTASFPSGTSTPEPEPEPEPNPPVGSYTLHQDTCDAFAASSTYSLQAGTESAPTTNNTRGRAECPSGMSPVNVNGTVTCVKPPSGARHSQLCKSTTGGLQWAVPN